MKTKKEVPHAEIKETQVQEESQEPKLNPAALQSLYDTLRECQDSLLHSPLTGRIEAALRLAESR